MQISKLNLIESRWRKKEKLNILKKLIVCTSLHFLEIFIRKHFKIIEKIDFISKKVIWWLWSCHDIISGYCDGCDDNKAIEHNSLPYNPGITKLNGVYFPLETICHFLFIPPPHHRAVLHHHPPDKVFNWAAKYLLV